MQAANTTAIILLISLLIIRFIANLSVFGLHYVRPVLLSCKNRAMQLLPVNLPEFLAYTSARRLKSWQ